MRKALVRRVPFFSIGASKAACQSKLRIATFKTLVGEYFDLFELIVLIYLLLLDLYGFIGGCRYETLTEDI